MRAKLTYPVKATFYLEEHWPLQADGIELSFRVEDGLVTGIVCMWSLGDEDRPPKLLPLKEGQTGFGGVDFYLGRRSEIEHLVRTIQGLLTLNGVIDVDFERPTLEWLADTPDEELGIELILSSNPPETNAFKPERLDFGVIARAVASAGRVAHLEVALSFLRRGRRDLKERRYIDAFYNCFFFLETQFAAGLSSRNKVAAKLKTTDIIMRAIDAIRHDPVDPPVGFATNDQLSLWGERLAFLARTNEAIIDELVRLRGLLHHHSLRRQENWHPDKGSEFRAASYTLHDIAFAVAHLVARPLQEGTELDTACLQFAEAAGAVTTLRFEATGIFPSRRSTRVGWDIQSAGTFVSREMVESADRHFRRILAERVPDGWVNEYTITHPVDGRVYGRYERMAWPPTPTPKRRSHTKSD